MESLRPKPFTPYAAYAYAHETAITSMPEPPAIAVGSHVIRCESFLRRGNIHTGFDQQTAQLQRITELHASYAHRIRTGDVL